MAHGPEEHLEHAEHAHHAGRDPFDRRVAMTIAIVAALLACLTMVSHREHNDTLRFQTEANINHTKAADQWSFFQAKKIRQYMFETGSALLDVTAKDSNNPKAAAKGHELGAEWQAKVKTYESEADGIQEKAKQFDDEGERLQVESEHAHHRATRFDLGELGVELALVLCSVAVLTKDFKFWYAGMAFGIAGVAVALTALFLT